MPVCELYLNGVIQHVITLSGSLIMSVKSIHDDASISIVHSLLLLF